MGEVRDDGEWRLPFTVRIGLATSATAWPAAGYGALTIVVAGDLHATGTTWIFGWPFLLLLGAATLIHALAATGRFGYRSLATLNQLLASPRTLAARPPATLREVLAALVRFPVWNAWLSGALAMNVVIAAAGLERLAVGGPSPNTGVIVRAGLYATLLYSAASMALGELLVRPVCRDLRRAAHQAGVDPYDGYVVPPWRRVSAAMLPTLVALLVATEIGLSRHAEPLAYLALVGVSAVVAVGFSWLQHENRQSAARELTAACGELAAGRDGVLVTGTIERPLLEMAEAFNAASWRIGADRRAATKRYLALFEGAGAAIVLVEPTAGRVVGANARAERLFGRPAAELAQLDYLALYAEDTRERHRASFTDGLPTAEVFLADGEILRADGTACPVDVSLSVLPVGDDWLVQAVLHDVSDRRRIERERATLLTQLGEQNEVLRAAQARLMEADRLRSEFVGMMSHELRTPVNIILGYTQMLIDAHVEGTTLSASECTSLLERMWGGGQLLASLVEDTLSVLRLEAGVTQLELQPLRLADLFRDLELSDLPARRSRPVEEHWVVDGDGLVLVTDRRKLRQVLTNLVSNARKFTDSGRIEVRARGGPGDDEVMLVVSDTGCGIAAEHLPYIFDLYRQAPSGRAHDGCGIGLYIVRRFVEMLGGSVECRSEAGIGTSFTLRLPGRLREGAVGNAARLEAGRAPFRAERARVQRISGN